MNERTAVIDEVISYPNRVELQLCFGPSEYERWTLTLDKLVQLAEYLDIEQAHDLIGKKVVVDDQNNIKPYRGEEVAVRYGKVMERANAVITDIQPWHGNTDHDWFLDVLIDGHGPGRLYLTSNQVAEIAAVWGDTSPRQLINKKIVLDREEGGEWYYVGPWEGGMEGDSLLKPEEERVLNHLSQAYNYFIELPPLHPQDQAEFMRAIHQAQNIVMSRPVVRRMKE